MVIKRVALAALAVCAFGIFGQTASAGPMAGVSASVGKQSAGTADSALTFVQGRRDGVGRGFSGGRRGFAGRGYGGGRRFSGGGRYYGGRRYYGGGRNRFYYGLPLLAVPFALGAYAYNDGYYNDGYAGGGSCYARCRQFRGPEYCSYNAREFC